MWTDGLAFPNIRKTSTAPFVEFVMAKESHDISDLVPTFSEHRFCIIGCRFRLCTKIEKGKWKAVNSGAGDLEMGNGSC